MSDYDLADFSPLRILTASILGDVFRAKVVPHGDPLDDGDGLHVHYCEYISCAGCRDHQLRVSGILAIKDDPNFVRILRSKIYEELGKQLIDYPPRTECQFCEEETSSLYVEVGDA